MRKIVFDADALIKLGKAGIFNHVQHQCLISDEVYKETVVDGKKRFYEDAFAIEQLIARKKLTIKKVRNMPSIEGLGHGERSAFALFVQEKADVIVSDDKRFLRFLHEQDIPFIISTDFILSMNHGRKLSKKEAEEALGRIKDFVKKEYYENAINEIR